MHYSIYTYFSFLLSYISRLELNLMKITFYSNACRTRGAGHVRSIAQMGTLFFRLIFNAVFF